MQRIRLEQDAKLWDHIMQEYEIGSVLGQGSFGKVIKCKKKSDGKVYAIKLITNIFDGIHNLK